MPFSLEIAAARIGRRIRQRERLLLIAIARLTVHVSRVVHRRHILGSQRRYSNVRRQPDPLTAALPHPQDPALLELHRLHVPCRHDLRHQAEAPRLAQRHRVGLRHRVHPHQPEVHHKGHLPRAHRRQHVVHRKDPQRRGYHRRHRTNPVAIEVHRIAVAVDAGHHDQETMTRLRLNGDTDSALHFGAPHGQ